MKWCKESKNIDSNDIDYTADIYKGLLYKKKINFILGKPNYTYIENDIIFLNIYLVNLDRIIARIGIYEIDNNILELLKDNCMKVIVFNKMDLQNGYTPLKSNKEYTYKAVSAKNKTNINELFISSIHDYLKKNLKYILENNRENNITLTDKINRNNCCYSWIIRNQLQY